MAAKKSNSSKNNLLSVLAIAVGIYLVILGVLSGEGDSMRSFMLALGLAVFATGTIGFRAK